jgi:WD40 repeat protein
VPAGRLADSVPGRAQAVAFSPDGGTLAVGNDDGTVYLDSVRGQRITGQPAVLGGSTQTITSLAFSPNGQTLLAAGYEPTIRLWNVPTRSLVAAITTHGSGVTFAAEMSYNGPTGMIATAGEVTQVWQTDPDQVAADICGTLRAPVSQQTWHKYLPEYPYTEVCG